MLKVYCCLIALISLGAVYSQTYVDDVCTLKASGGSGTCKLFSNCESARNDLQKFNRYPDICGFRGTEPIVCCSESKPERSPGVVSKRKCREYARYVYERRPSPVLLINASDVVRDECGHKVVKLIVGGTRADRKEFPHMAAIGYEPTPGDVQWLCGGTIISKDYILTAAHCLSDFQQGDAKWVKLGVTSLNDTNHRQEFKVADRIPYPQYRSNSHYHDIGLIKLETSARMNPYARPACLHLDKNVNAEKAIATGWGKTSWAGDGSNSLLKVTIDLYDNTFCNASYKNQISRKLRNGIMDDIQLCAGSASEEKDTCQGDSGGPLQIYHVGDQIRCMYDIIGVTSFGKGCAGSPGVYVRVSHYIQWIEDIVWPQ